MISSAPRLKGVIELVTKAISTLSSTPDSASRTTSRADWVSLRLGGNDLPVEIGWTGALVRAASSPGSAAAAAGLAADSAVCASFAGGVAAVVLVAWFD